jgi:hypothetical protein
MKLNPNIVAVLVVLLFGVSIYLGIKQYYSEKKYADLEEEIKKEKIRNINYTDSINTSTAYKMKVQQDSIIVVFKRKLDNTNAKIKKDNEKFDDINSANIFLPEF